MVNIAYEEEMASELVWILKWEDGKGDNMISSLHLYWLSVPVFFFFFFFQGAALHNLTGPGVNTNSHIAQTGKQQQMLPIRQN